MGQSSSGITNCVSPTTQNLTGSHESYCYYRHLQGAATTF